MLSPFSVVRHTRNAIQLHFAADTSVDPTVWSKLLPSTGHCAAVATILHGFLYPWSARLVSTKFAGQSHWFNRFTWEQHQYDVDITGDQFGLHPVQVDIAGELYPNTRTRTWEEVNEATRERARKLRDRAGFEVLI